MSAPSPEKQRAPQSQRGPPMSVHKKARQTPTFRERIQPLRPQSQSYEERSLQFLCICAQTLLRIEAMLRKGGDDE